MQSNIISFPDDLYSWLLSLKIIHFCTMLIICKKNEEEITLQDTKWLCDNFFLYFSRENFDIHIHTNVCYYGNPLHMPKIT